MARAWQVRSTPPELAAGYADGGLWTDDTLGQLLEVHLRECADLELRVWSATRPYAGTLGEVFQAARRFAAELVARGVEPGDVVAFQLPNCPEAAVVFWGAALAGAVLVPIVHFYGPKEVGFIIEQAQPKVTITRADLGDDALSLGDWLDPGRAPLAAPVSTDPDQPALIAYTSGTTANPKGVIHTHRSIVAEVRQLGDVQPASDRPTLSGAPVGHAIGMLATLLLPVYRHGAIHVIDAWDPARILEIMLEADLSAGSGATFFLTSLLDAPGFTAEHAERMRHIGLGGSSVPEAVADRAIALGLSVTRAYGSTEHPSTTGASHGLPQDHRKRTDGHPLAGVEIRTVDANGDDVGIGEPGEILSRGPDLCAGYTDAALTAQAFDADGWYRTGDIGVIDAEGWLVITDRVKDIIIRGGENISAVEVEEQLVRLPGVAEVAVVAAPDRRMGEHACAFVRMVPSADGSIPPPPDLAAVRAHFEAAGMAKQKWPEEIRGITEFPRTPSGKVKKFALRDLARTRPEEQEQP